MTDQRPRGTLGTRSMRYVDHDHGQDDDRDDDPDTEGDWDGDEADDEGDDESTVPCPFCRREMFEDSPQCPSCGEYVSAADFARNGRPRWVLVTAAVCLAMAVLWALLGR